MATQPVFSSLSKELQLLIVERCDMPTLYQLCLTNREMYQMAWPTLWKTIDFVNADYPDAAEWQRRFFATCDVLREEHRERFDVLAARVETLQLARLPGPQITHGKDRDIGAWSESDFYCGDGRFTIFDSIVHFAQLSTLTVFLKNDWVWNDPSDQVLQALKGGLPKLRTLKLGGQINVETVEALLSRPELIEELSLINLVSMCGQIEGPDPLLFLKPIQHRFTSLKSLHLSKLGDMNIRDEYDGIPERESLEEWIGLLRASSSTLVHLTLEMCYSTFRRDIDEDSEDHEIEHSEEQFKEMMLPTLLECEWPKLQRLVLVGLEILESLIALPDRIQVEFLPRRMVNYNYESTPLEVSPPNEVFADDWQDNLVDV